jgi:hypothetical protein
LKHPAFLAHFEDLRVEKDRRIRQLERTLGRKSLEIEILKNVVGGVSCGAVHSQPENW